MSRWVVGGWQHRRLHARLSPASIAHTALSALWVHAAATNPRDWSATALGATMGLAGRGRRRGGELQLLCRHW